jgi:hypothetical protein
MDTVTGMAIALNKESINLDDERAAIRSLIRQNYPGSTVNLYLTDAMREARFLRVEGNKVSF